MSTNLPVFHDLYLKGFQELNIQVFHIKYKFFLRRFWRSQNLLISNNLLCQLKHFLALNHGILYLYCANIRT